jgi:PKD repeat protein
MTTKSLSQFGIRCAALALVTASAVSCGLEKQTAPPLAGPSEFGLSLTVSAIPDTLVADGQSESLIRVVARDPSGNPMSGVAVRLDVTADQLVSTSLRESQVVTDASGQATTALLAPSAPATQFAVDPVLTVTAFPVGTNFGNSAAQRTVNVRVVAPDGTPNGNSQPVAMIVANPPVANFNETIRFDASYSTDEGLACTSHCTYIWEFGDNTVSVRGVTADHKFTLPGEYTVTLTVLDDRGGSDTASMTVRIIGPTAPVAVITAPASGTTTADVNFSGAASTVGTGATISQYAWDFGDGTPTQTSSSATISHRYLTIGAKTVTLTVTDSLGRVATAIATVTVQ